MFKGEVLTPSGWSTPALGQVIACMGGSKKVTWQKIENLEIREEDLVHVKSRCLSYAISLDHRLFVHRASPLNPIAEVTGSDIYKACRIKDNRLRFHHITHAYPELSVCNPVAVIQDFALAHLDSDNLKAIPEKSLSIFRRYLDYRLVYPQAYLHTEKNQECYRMCHKSAVALLALLFPKMRGHDGIKRPKATTLARCYPTHSPAATDLLQMACFFSGITSVVIDNTLKLYLYSKRSHLPFKPEITNSSTVMLERSPAFEINVKNPLVRLDKKVVIL